jgi:hypothetical protein
LNELICHLIGDYCLQNHWMAARKTSSWFAASIHGLAYMVPFVVLGSASVAALLVMLATHVVIDRFRLARYWVEFYGIGTGGVFCPSQPPAPDYLRVWLLIIVDNTIHLTINRAAIELL